MPSLRLGQALEPTLPPLQSGLLWVRLSRRRRRCPLGGGPCVDTTQPRLQSAPFGGDGEASADTATLASQLSEDAEDNLGVAIAKAVQHPASRFAGRGA